VLLVDHPDHQTPQGPPLDEQVGADAIVDDLEHTQGSSGSEPTTRSTTTPPSPR